VRRRRSRSEEGAAAAEFAIVLPLLIIMVFGIVEFGQAYFRMQGVQAAAREGARVGAVEPGSECAQAAATMSGLDPETFTCTVVQSCPGDRAIVEVLATETIEIPIVGTRTANLSARGEFRCEVQ
jgi:hypothetical protein